MNVFYIFLTLILIVAIIGTSGGAPSAIQFAQKYLEKCSTLVSTSGVTKEIQKGLSDYEKQYLEKLFKSMHPI